jgi:hypothetical protein
MTSATASSYPPARNPPTAATPVKDQREVAAEPADGDAGQ